MRFIFYDDLLFKIPKFLLACGFGALVGMGFYFWTVHHLPIPVEMKIYILYGMTGFFTVCWGFSYRTRCATFLMIPQVASSEGLAMVQALAITFILTGPVSNFVNNFKEVERSIACTADLQINNTKLLWKIISEPLKSIFEDVVSSLNSFKNRGNGMNTAFRNISNELESTEGYDSQKLLELAEKETALTEKKSLQLKTILRCEFVIEMGIIECRKWFDDKHAECMRLIWLPGLNHLLCSPLQLKIVCNLMYLINDICERRQPLKADFWDKYDKLRGKVSGFISGASLKMASLKNHIFETSRNITRTFTAQILETLEEKKKEATDTIQTIQLFIESFLGLFLFISAFKYTTKYNADIRFDNHYITRYFRQIDARRRKLEKRHLLPLRKGEYSNYVFPFRMWPQGPECSSVVSEILPFIPVFLLLISSLAADYLLYAVLQIIHKHAYIEYEFSSHHKLKVTIRGETWIANVLRDVIGKLNSQSSTQGFSNNLVCLPIASRMSTTDYLWTFLPIVGVIVFSFLRVYTCRLRRVLASFYFPKREKRRVLFMYNELLRKRAVYIETMKQKLLRRAKISGALNKTFGAILFKHCKWMRRFISRRCALCQSIQTVSSITCLTPGCEIYCRRCWKDMGKYCYACCTFGKVTFVTDGIDED